MSAPVRASCFGAGVEGVGGVAGGVDELGVEGADGVGVAEGVGVVDGVGLGVGVTDGVGVEDGVGVGVAVGVGDGVTDGVGLGSGVGVVEGVGSGVGVAEGVGSGVGVTDGVGVGFASPFASPEPSEWMSTPPVYSFALMSASLWKVTPLRTVAKLLIVASYCRT